jgi:hypothetical protein
MLPVEPRQVIRNEKENERGSQKQLVRILSAHTDADRWNQLRCTRLRKRQRARGPRLTKKKNSQNLLPGCSNNKKVMSCYYSGDPPTN